ncbi:hypothetical protein CkaCkLH20_09342 [Colletotrichum karsti]|uniref:galacturonan 1,4-alpha-galacturonidase n=1 Tax=Colletotrichum karsti TaxID=1095194 RepID=A0A9P6LEH6_9PEZI|nr:uncharacterized protein CkaCkLH20_09342 [Colletotrichum karsti]KAF9873179.1 hypothetical protein CkaCkLH20_09342 [Colletotrichum karsti]
MVRDQKLLNRIRTEVNTAMIPGATEETMLDIDITKLSALPLLNAVYNECLRLRSSIPISRRLRQDIEIDGYTLKKDNFILAPSWLSHIDDTVWAFPGHPAREFWAERFLQPETRKVKLGDYCPYGGGSVICPGRFFAKHEILAAVAMMVTLFDLEFERWSHLDGSPADRGLGMEKADRLAVAAITFSAALVEAQAAPKRPNIQATPHSPFKSFTPSTSREDGKTCFVKPSCTPGRDDAPKILAALEDCNDGGTVVLDKAYTVCSRLDLRFLKKIDIALTGSITFCDDLDVWTPDYLFQFPFQDQSTWWLWGGEDVNLYGLGTGTIDGNGQAWYDAHGADSTVERPLLFVTDGWHGGSITGLKIRSSPQWHFLIANSSDLLVSDIDVYSRSTSQFEAKNLDGWDTYRSDNIVIQNSYLDHDDDCVSFKPNSTNILVQGLTCNSSHGISVGSLGQYPGVWDVVENLYIYNISMSNATDSARLKVWPGEGAVTNPGWIGGGGAGIVRNVTYERFFVNNNDAALKIDQCYGAVNASTCQENPSLMVITDVVFKDFFGKTSKKSDPVVGSLICSDQDSCDNIQAFNITVEPPSGKPAQWKCRNMDAELLDLSGVGCVAG